MQLSIISEGGKVKRKQFKQLQCLCIPHIVTRNGKAVYVDQANLAKLNKYRWFVLKSSAVKYVVTKIRIAGYSKYLRIHRLLTNCPKSMEVHHIDRNPMNNRLDNLYVVSPGNHKKLHQHLSRIYT